MVRRKRKEGRVGEETKWVNMEPRRRVVQLLLSTIWLKSPLKKTRSIDWPFSTT